jgi:hypothetical protein
MNKKIDTKALAKEIIKKLPTIEHEATCEMHKWSSGDWFGPSLDDHHDREIIVVTKVEEIIKRYLNLRSK